MMAYGYWTQLYHFWNSMEQYIDGIRWYFPSTMGTFDKLCTMVMGAREDGDIDYKNTVTMRKLFKVCHVQGY